MKRAVDLGDDSGHSGFLRLPGLPRVKESSSGQAVRASRGEQEEVYYSVWKSGSWRGVPDPGVVPGGVPLPSPVV